MSAFLEQKIFLVPAGEEIPELTETEELTYSGDFQITRSMVEQATLLKNACTDDKIVFIPLENISREHLKYVVEFLKIAESTKMNKIEEPLPSKDIRECVTPTVFADYIEQEYFADYKNLHQIILAANYIDCNDLLDLSCAKIASLCKGKSKEELKLIFQIE